MKAVRYYTKRDIRVEDVPAPSGPLGDDMVLIEPLVCGICGTDLHEYIAGPIVTPSTVHVYSGATLPQILGHEFSARVLEVGRNVTHVSPGSRVSVQPLISPRDDYYGRRGLYHLSEKMACVGLSWDWGGMGERAVVNGYNVFPVPDSVSDVQAAMIEPAAVALYGIDRGGVEAGSTVLVSGVGPRSVGDPRCRCDDDLRVGAQFQPPCVGKDAGTGCDRVRSARDGCRKPVP
jgi:(R,R)-butanediol dehydrogenase/meso-butanediol dehydrogenase/diacetyl reductase